jgi:dTMP kinase
MVAIYTFEGIDGCGKSSQIARLEKHFKHKGLRVKTFHDGVGSNRICDSIKLLLKYNSDDLDYISKTLLLQVIRRSIYKDIITSIEQGADVILLSRTVLSTVVYQTIGLEETDVDYLKLMQVITYVTNDLIDHISEITDDYINFYLRCSPETALQRDPKAGDYESFYSTSDKLNFLKTIREKYDNIMFGFSRVTPPPDNLVVIDAELSEDEMFEEILISLNNE